HLARQPHDRLIETGRGIDLELDVQDLPAPAEIRDDLAEIGLGRRRERVRQIARVAAGERVVETALTFQCRRRALKPLRGEARRPHAAPGRLSLGKIGVARARALALDEASGEARRQRDRVTDAARVEAEQPGRRRGAAEDAVARARAPSIHNVAPWPAPSRRGPRRSCSSTARRAAAERSWPAPTRPTVTAWFTNAFALSTTAAGSSS